MVCVTIAWKELSIDAKFNGTSLYSCWYAVMYVTLRNKTEMYALTM